MPPSAARAVLQQIIIRGNPEQDFFCFPGYDTLALDAGISMISAARGVKELVKTGFIRVLFRVNRPNHYRVNIKHLFDLAHEKREEKLKQDHLSKVDSDETDVLDYDESEWTTEDVVKVLHELWPAHHSLQSPTASSFLRDDMQSCVDMAKGSAAAAGYLLRVVGVGNPDLHRTVADSRRLGAYVVCCFPGWLKRFYDIVWPAEKSKESPD